MKTNTLQSRIKELRKINGLSQAKMADLLRQKYGLKTDRVMISKWETGFQTPEIYTISCIADLFNVSLDYLNGQEEITEPYGVRIKKRREQLGMSQDELAKKLGYKSRSSINKIELGINDITFSKIVELAEILEISPNYLMGWKSELTDTFFKFLIKNCDLPMQELTKKFNQKYNTNVQLEELPQTEKQLTLEEKELLKAYHEHPELQHSVKLLLGLEKIDE